LPNNQPTHNQDARNHYTVLKQQPTTPKPTTKRARCLRTPTACVAVQAETSRANNNITNHHEPASQKPNHNSQAPTRVQLAP